MEMVNAFDDDSYNSCYAARLMLDEKNLFGAYPVINTKWYYDLSQNKAGIVEMPYTYVGFSASNF